MHDSSFKPVLRFMACSDIHYKDEDSIERERMKKALEMAYREADADEMYKGLDALYVVGDFANSGTEEQMRAFKKTLDEGVRPGTEVVLTMASHEFKGSSDEEGAHVRFAEIFRMPPDDHRVIKGFHFISLTTTRGTHFSDEKVAYAAQELKKARADAPKKPIFFFQHPHVTDTVCGSINWGEDELYATLMDYPQIINYSGHSHAPVNDPRSIHQKHFTSVGTGSMSYFELDEFDKIYGTVPPDAHEDAQFLITEADADGNVRIYPFDVLTGKQFPFTWIIDRPWDPSGFRYTDDRYKTTVKPLFASSAAAVCDEITADGFRVTFPQATFEGGPVDDYVIRVLEADTGLIVRSASIFSGYYLYTPPATLSQTFTGLESGRAYRVSVTAGSFWKTHSEPLETAVTTL